MSNTQHLGNQEKSKENDEKILKKIENGKYKNNHLII